MFQSDFGLVAKWLGMKRKKEIDYRKLCGRMKHPAESLMLLCALELDPRYLTVFENEESEEECGMEKFWDIAEGVGRKQGLEEGMAKGKAEGMAAGMTLLSKLYEAGREADVKRAVEDEAYRSKLLEEFAITA